MKLGFIGCGNMATAILKGIADSKLLAAEDICVYDANAKTLENVAAKYGVQATENASALAQKCDHILLAVKPNVIQSVLQEINADLKDSGKIIISIAAGKTIDFLRSALTQNNKIIRVMPNINAKVAEAVCAFCCNEAVTEEEKDEVAELLQVIGKVIELDEKFFPLFGVISGCSPAFVYMFIDALARAGVKNGMSKDMALQIAAQAVYGSAKMVLENPDTHPWQLIDMVCSPGGTTIEGVLTLQKEGFETAVHDAVQNAVDKDKSL